MAPWRERLRPRMDLIAVVLPSTGPGTFLRSVITDGELRIVERGTFTSWAEAPFSKRWPVVACVHGPGVVHRRLSGHAADDRAAFALAFPAAGEQALTATVVRSRRAFFVDVIGTARADALLADAHKAGYRVVDLVVGPSIVALLHDAAGKPVEMITPDGSLAFVDDELDTMTAGPPDGGTVRIGSDELDPSALLAFAAAFAFVSGKHGSVGRMPQRLGTARREEAHRKRFDSLLRTAIASVAILLVVLSLIRGSIDRRHEANAQALLDDRGRAEHRAQLKASIAEKEAIVRDAGLNAPVHAASKADQVASAVPPGVVLDRMAIDVGNSSGARTLPGAGRDTIVVSGHLSDPILLNTFISALEDRPAFGGVKLRSVVPAGHRDGGAKFELMVYGR